MVRLQFPHKDVAAPAPWLSLPSVHPAVLWRFHSTNCDLRFNPRPCFRLLYWRSGLYKGVMQGNACIKNWSQMGCRMPLGPRRPDR